MQRTSSNSIPPKRNANSQAGAQQNSPALNMARRIRSEQGSDRARQYLMAMEPYLAPAERAHIAEQIGIQLPRSAPSQAPQSTPQAQEGFNMFQQPGAAGGMGNPMQLVQMLSSLSGGAKAGASTAAGASAQPFGGLGAGKGGMDPMALMQLMNMMQKR